MVRQLILNIQPRRYPFHRRQLLGHSFSWIGYNVIKGKKERRGRKEKKESGRKINWSSIDGRVGA